MRSGFHFAIDLATSAAGQQDVSLQSWMSHLPLLHLIRQPVSPMTAIFCGVLPTLASGSATPLIVALVVPAGTTASQTVTTLADPRAVMATLPIFGQVELAGRIVRAISAPPGPYCTHVGFAAYSGHTTSSDRSNHPHFRI